MSGCRGTGKGWEDEIDATGRSSYSERVNYDNAPRRTADRNYILTVVSVGIHPSDLGLHGSHRASHSRHYLLDMGPAIVGIVGLVGIHTGFGWVCAERRSQGEGRSLTTGSSGNVSLDTTLNPRPALAAAASSALPCAGLRNRLRLNHFRTLTMMRVILALHKCIGKASDHLEHTYV
jgi:hypothetical protein